MENRNAEECRESQRFFSNVLIIAYNSSLERSHPIESKTGFIFVVGQIDNHCCSYMLMIN